MATPKATAPGATMIAKYKASPFFTYKSQVPQTPGTSLAFQPGSGYYASTQPHASATGTTGADPFAQWTPQQIGSLINQYAPAPTSNTQVTSDARAQLDPIIAAITKSVGDQTSAASGSIAANSAALAKDLASLDYSAPYAGAKEEQAAVDAALQQSLGAGGGTQLAQDLSSRLGQIGDPSVAAAASGVAGRGAAIGTTELAHGSNALSNLIAQAAAAKEYGVKQPGIARLAGLQDIAGVQRQATTDIGDKTAQVMAQLPQIVQSLRGQNDQRQQARAALFGALTGQNVTKATAKAGLVGDQSKLQYQQGQDTFNNTLDYAKTYKVDPVTGQPLPGYTKNKNGQIVPVPKKTAAKPLSTKDRQSMMGALDTYYWGKHPQQHYDSQSGKFLEVPGTGVPGVDYQTAVRNLEVIYSLTPEQAVSLVNTVYPFGQRGRPMSAEQKSKKALAGSVASQAATITASTGGATPKAKPKPYNKPWSAATDPIVGPGPSGSGLHRTRSGRLVDSLGNYSDGKKR